MSKHLRRCRDQLTRLLTDAQKTGRDTRSVIGGLTVVARVDHGQTQVTLVGHPDLSPWEELRVRACLPAHAQREPVAGVRWVRPQGTPLEDAPWAVVVYVWSNGVEALAPAPPEAQVVQAALCWDDPEGGSEASAPHEE